MAINQMLIRLRVILLADLCQKVIENAFGIVICYHNAVTQA